MKWKVYFFCLIFGHNKILEKFEKKGYSKYYIRCTQCEKTWLHKQLSEKPIKYKLYKISMKGYGKKLQINKINFQLSPKKAQVNFYAL